MSRSYKKHPIVTDKGKYTYQDKRHASKAVRNSKNVSNGGSYKKCFCSYDIQDYFYGEYSWEEAWEELNTREDTPNSFYFPSSKVKSPSKKDLQREFHKKIGKW